MVKTGFSKRFWQLYASSYKRLWMLMLSAALIGLFSYFFSHFSLLRDIEKRSEDLRFTLAPHPELADKNIVLVAIDQASLRYAAELGQGWPFPRSYYALINSYLASENASAVVYDILFDEPDFFRGEESPEDSDLSFANSLQEGGISYLAFGSSPDPQPLSPSFLKHATLNPAALNALKLPGAQTPIEPFLASAAGIGGISLAKGTDSILRSVPAYYKVGSAYFPNLALAVQPTTTALPNYPDNELPLFWYGAGGGQGVFTYLPFSVLLYSAVAELKGESPMLPKAYFSGKQVFIGAAAAGLMDLKSSPYTWGLPGMEVWATLLSNLKNGHHVRYPSQAISLALVFLVSLLVFIIVSRAGAGYSPILAILLLLTICGAAWLVFNYFFVMLDATSLVSSWLFSWLFILTISYWAEGKHKRELRQIFGRYLHPELVDRITANPALVQMGGEELEATVLFSDIYNFTKFSENRQPPELVSYLNEYFSTFTNTILDNNGMLDKYTGDGLMAVFGVPLQRSDHALCACRAALVHRNMALGLGPKEPKTPCDMFHLGTRIGINSGSIVAGNIGSQRRMEYTSIGDPVNLASRLEGANKLFGTHIIISESTYKLVHEQVIVRELDYIQVKGKDTPTRIYELLDLADSTVDYSWINTYNKALQLYRQGDFAEAAQAFSALCEEPYSDKPSAIMRERCLKLQAVKPDNWTNILVLETK